MIIFNGEISNNSKNYLLRYNKIGGFISGLIPAIIILIPIIILTIVSNWAYAIAIPFIVIFPFITSIPCSKKNRYQIYPVEIKITDEQILCTNSKYNLVRELSQIKFVKDFGGFYHIQFDFPHRDIHFLCQKDLMVKGTIGEFEALFKGKIIRKSK